MRKSFKVIIWIAVWYLLIGLVYGMIGEMRLARKYGGSSFDAFRDPYAYVRAAVFSPFWPIALFATIYNCGNPFGCQIRPPVSTPRVWSPQTDTQGAVTVEVKPVELSANAPVWKFEVTLDTHSVELDDDMTANAFLIDNSGNEYQPIAWEGDPPGGHHRKGVLKFQSLSSSSVIQLNMQEVGGVVERIFEWNL